MRQALARYLLATVHAMEEDDPVADIDRQRMNVRVIRTSLTAALRYATPAEARLCIARAAQLLDHARAEAASTAVIAEIDELRSEITNGLEPRAESREG